MEFKVTSLEDSLINEIQKIRQDQGLNPLTLRSDLYTVALNHVRSIGKNNNTNLNDKIDSREKLFWNAKKYTEINFITKPCESEPIQTIVSIIKTHFMPQITSQINAIGPAVIKLKSNRYIVSILCAFFAPKISLREVYEKIPEVKTLQQPSTNFESLIELINRLREMIPFQPFNIKKVEATNEQSSKKKIVNAKTSSELFCSLLTDRSFFNAITDLWTDFSYSSQEIDSNHHLKLNFSRGDDHFVYEVILKGTDLDQQS